MKSFIRCVLSLLLACIAACTDSAPPAVAHRADPDSLRRLHSGAVSGFVNGAGGHAWLGLPYAAPPVGTLRWRPPQPPAPWEGTRSALNAGSPCIQYGWPLGGVGKDGTHQGQEDCLYLNVYAPKMDAASAATARLPVMVWIHGGSNTVGHAAGYDGSRLAATQNLIVVMINYRLGPFGWFVLPRGGASDEHAVDPVEASGNWGILDALASLHWVQQNIAAFGGDPGNVTVFGESAGATDVLALMVSPLSAGLVQRAIVQSLGFGFAPLPRVSNYVDDAEPGDEWSSAEILLKLLVQQGRASDRAAAKALVAGLSRDAIGEFLRGIDPWVLYAAYHPSSIETDRFPTVFQDGAVVRKGSIQELLADPARHLAVPAIFGTNRDEPKLFMAFDPRLVVTAAGMPLWIRDPQAYDREAAYRARLWKAKGVDEPARAIAAGGGEVYAYRWDWRDEGERYGGLLDISRLIGASHGLEIPFVFGEFAFGAASGLLFTAQNETGRLALSEAMMGYWAEFAATGKPGRGRSATLPEWPAWPLTPEAPRLLVLDTPAGGGIRVTDEQVTRDAVVEQMAATETTDPSACTMFRATFRNRHDAFGDAAWQHFKNGYCAEHFAGEGRYRP